MGQVAFDTQEFVETLENAGITKEHARAISLAVRKSHEVADGATKADIVELKHEIAEVNRNVADVRKDLSAEITDVRKEIASRFEKTDLQIAEVRKDLSAQIASVKRDISDVRKDMEALTDKLLIKVTKVIIGCVGLASTIVTLAIKFL